MTCRGGANDYILYGCCRNYTVVNNVQKKKEEEEEDR